MLFESRTLSMLVFRCDPRPLRLETGSPWVPYFGSAAAQDARSSATVDMPIATIRDTNLLRHNTALLVVQRLEAGPGCLLVSYITLAPSWLEIEEATLAVRLQLLHFESTGLHS